MAADNIQEVGARFVMSNGAKFIATIDAATASLQKFNTEQARAAELSKGDATANADNTKTLLGNADASKIAAGASSDAAAATAKQVEATDALALSAKRTAGVQVDSAVAMAASWKKTQAVAGTILKYAGVAGAAVLYEGIKNYNSFQQMMAQGAIDAGLKASQLPALSKWALEISNKTGLAAAGTNGIADAMYRIASAYPGLHLSTKALGGITQQAANLAVIFGQTGNLDSISRIYGAIMSSGVSMTSGGKAVPATTAGALAINKWMRAVVGHSDVKGGDLVAAMGTGILQSMPMYNISLDQMGAAFSVMAKAMPASMVTTRLAHGFAIMNSPTAQAAQVFSMLGGNALTTVQAGMKGGLTGTLGALNKLFYNSKVNPANFFSKFYGMGMGSMSGGKGGTPTGAMAMMRSWGLTPAQIEGITSGKTGLLSVPGAQQEFMVKAFGGAKYMQTVVKLLDSYRSGQYGTSLAKVSGGQQGTAYEQALRLAYAEPIVKFNKFKEQFKNFTIIVGKDVTPAFDGFLSDLEKLGNWFGHNKGLLRLLGIAGAGVVAGAALIKTAEMAGSLYRGGAAIIKTTSTIMSNPGALKGLLTGGTGAADMQMNAARIQLEAAELARGGKGVIPGGATAAKGGVAGFLSGAASVAAKLGLAVTAGDIIGNELGKTPWFKSLGVTPNKTWANNGIVKGIHGGAGRLLNIFDTIGNITTGGVWHPHLNTVGQTTMAEVYGAAAKWAGVAPGSLSPAQLGTLANYWNTGNKSLSPSQRATVTAMGTNSLTAAHKKSTSALEDLVRQVEATGKLHDSTKVNSQLTQEQREASVLLQKAATDLLAVSPALMAALSPANIHSLATTGLKGKASRQ